MHKTLFKSTQFLIRKIYVLNLKKKKKNISRTPLKDTLYHPENPAFALKDILYIKSSKKNLPFQEHDRLKALQNIKCTFLEKIL